MESVSREGILKRKVACPNCGRMVSLKYLSTRHVCALKKRGPTGPRARRDKDPTELEEWAAELERKAVNAFLRRVAVPDASAL
jgi:hypothetical protein